MFETSDSFRPRHLANTFDKPATCILVWSTTLLPSTGNPLLTLQSGTRDLLVCEAVPRPNAPVKWGAMHRFGRGVRWCLSARLFDYPARGPGRRARCFYTLWGGICEKANPTRPLPPLRAMKTDHVNVHAFRIDWMVTYRARNCGSRVCDRLLDQRLVCCALSACGLMP